MIADFRHCLKPEPTECPVNQTAREIQKPQPALLVSLLCHVLLLALLVVCARMEYDQPETKLVMDLNTHLVAESVATIPVQQEKSTADQRQEQHPAAGTKAPPPAGKSHLTSSVSASTAKRHPRPSSVTTGDSADTKIISGQSAVPFERRLKSQTEKSPSSSAKPNHAEQTMNGKTAGKPIADERQHYLAMLRSRIEQSKTYPSRAVRRGLEGTAGVSFTLAPNGTISDVRVTESSGHRLLDEAAQAAVNAAAPFPAPPAGISHNRLKLTIDIVFALR